MKKSIYKKYPVWYEKFRKWKTNIFHNGIPDRKNTMNTVDTNCSKLQLHTQNLIYVCAHSAQDYPLNWGLWNNGPSLNLNSKFRKSLGQFISGDLECLFLQDEGKEESQGIAETRGI